MKTIITALLISAASISAEGTLRQLNGDKTSGVIFTMADCPGKCLTYNSTGAVALDDCTFEGGDKYWTIDHNCGGSDSFFQIKHVKTQSNKCIADPDDCSSCNQGIALVDCESDRAAWFSYGNLHKTGPKQYNLYSARCWLNEGKIMTLSTPSMDAKTCPENQAKGACERIEWNVDRFAKDVLYYEWSMNQVKTECDDALFIR